MSRKAEEAKAMRRKKTPAKAPLKTPKVAPAIKSASAAFSKMVKPAIELDVGAKVETLLDDVKSKAVGIKRAAWKNRQPALTENVSVSRAAVELCGEQLEKLLHREEFALAIGAMHCLRQMYVVALRELHDQVAALNKDKPEEDLLHPGLVDFATQYAMYQASKPFNEHHLMRMVGETLLPFMGEVIDKHSDEDATTAAKEQATNAIARQERLVPIDLAASPHQEGRELRKDRSLVLVGYEPALLWLIEEICKKVMNADHPAGGFMTVRCRTVAPPREEQHAWLANIAPNAWAGCANGDRHVEMFMGRHVIDKIAASPELLIFDDLALASNAGFAGRPPAAYAGDAQRRLRKWCDKADCGMIGLLPCDEMKEPDLSGHEYDQLRTFADLRPVDCTIAGDKAIICIGQEDIREVPLADLERCKRRTIIVPA